MYIYRVTLYRVNPGLLCPWSQQARQRTPRRRKLNDAALVWELETSTVLRFGSPIRIRIYFR